MRIYKERKKKGGKKKRDMLVRVLWTFEKKKEARCYDLSNRELDNLFSERST